MTYRPYSAIIQEAQSLNDEIFIGLINDTGSTIPALTPTSIGADGKLSFIDVSDPGTAETLAGVAKEDIADGSSGPVVLVGRIEDVSLSFPFGAHLYVSKSGGLTNIAPSIGVAGFLEGDAVIKVGVVARNPDVFTQKDLIVDMKLVGRL